MLSACASLSITHGPANKTSGRPPPMPKRPIETVRGALRVFVREAMRNVRLCGTPSICKPLCSPESRRKTSLRAIARAPFPHGSVLLIWLTPWRLRLPALLRRAFRRCILVHPWGNPMKHVLSLALCFVCLHAAASRAVAAVDASGLTAQEQQREFTLRNKLCANRSLSCDYVDTIFSDPRLTVYPPPEPAPPPSPALQKTRQRNPYLTERFGLLTPESLERCRSFIAAHSLAFEAAYTLYGVPREVIC